MKRARSHLAAAGALLLFVCTPSAAEAADTAPPPQSETATKTKEQELLDTFKKPETITNSVGVVMVWTAAGFRVAQVETTQALFESIVGRNPSKFQGGSRPVERVTLADAQEFCRKLSEQEQTEGKLPKTFAYTLPTESEFESYSEGTPIDTAWVSLIGDRPSTIAVGSTPANTLGLFDVRGNVWEWCANGVARGSSYQSHEDYLNPGFRFVGKADTATEDIGFRVILKETGTP